MSTNRTRLFRLSVIYAIGLAIFLVSCKPSASIKNKSSRAPDFRIKFEYALIGASFSPLHDKCVIADHTQFGVVELLSEQTERRTPPLANSLDDSIHSVEFSNDGSELLVTGTSDGVQILRTEDLKLKKEIGSFSERPSFAFLTLDGNDVICHANRNQLIRISAENGAPKWSMNTKFRDIMCVYARNDKWIALGESGEDRDGRVSLYSIADGKKSKFSIFHEKGVRGIAFTSDQKLIASTDDSGVLKVHDIDQEAIQLNFTIDAKGAFGVAFDPVGDLLAVGCMRGVKIWSIKKKKVVASWNAHEWFVQSLMFSSDGERLLTGSADASAAMWNVAEVLKLNQYRDW